MNVNLIKANIDINMSSLTHARYRSRSTLFIAWSLP
jgi:hypothetical protein